MTFLSPLAALLALAAVPLLVVLYLLKLRRRRLSIASTLLWGRTTEDLQANVPFQRLRWSLLLLLQLLIAAAIIASLGRPVLVNRGDTARRVILLIDTSASMSARAEPGADRGTTRLDAAREAARQIVSRLGRRQEPGELMIVTFARTAEVAIPFEGNRRLLAEVIEAIEPTDEEADLAAALELAGAFAQRDETAELPQVVVISDGGVAPPPPEGFNLRAGAFRFVGIGAGPSENVGITTLSARRDYRDPAQLLVFCRLLNAGPRPVAATVTLRVDGEPVTVRTVELEAAGDAGPAESSTTFELELPRQAIVTASLGRADDLAADDTAGLIVPPPAAPRIALVHPRDGPDPFLLSLVEAFEPARLVRLAADDGSAPDLRGREVEFDLVIYDRVGPARLPDVPSLLLGAAAGPVDRTPPARAGGARVASWDRHHPLLRHVSLDNVVYSDFGALELPGEAEVLARGADGPVIAVLPTRGARHVFVGFDLAHSNWPLDVSITVFFQNVLDYLTLAGQRAAQATRAGDVVTVRAKPDATALRIEGPVEAQLEVTPGAEVALPALRRVGVYVVDGAVPRDRRVAVNVLSPVESDIRPRESLTVNAASQQAGEARDAVPLELWPYLVAAAIAMLALEWIVYCARLRR